ncbi:hypothetical protein OS125_11320 [Corynebacterium sp. P7003]|uniref:Uncharacterized protein n=1 Tax=Corynebacterium pygosceleis TaxID=2800406 RepID=A0ABT3WYC8_9CORY|nr:hypothetical protein [Corynebacterium pygosceleis]MCX7445822.1 hypothetical protein [Corynebacterium pygosceleis]
MKLTFDKDAINKVIAAQCAAPIEAAGAAVASQITDVPVSTRMTVNKAGRPVCLVTITHPKGMASQAKHGTLTRAASAVGLDIHRYAP